MIRIAMIATWTVLLTVSQPTSALADGAILSEFMAVNDSTLVDTDGDSSDWIELHNPTTSPIDLAGYYLTDSADELDKWQFPPVTLEAGAYLTVFASGKDRTDAGDELHTNFKLSGNGEYLALVEPDGITIATEFAPEYPPQSADISYGLGGLISSDAAYIAHRSPAYAHVPSAADAGDEATWMTLGFDHSEWLAGLTDIGYDNATTYDSLIGLDVDAQMDGINESIWIRIPFTVADPSAVTALLLRMRYDDGFVAYLNGELIASGNEPTTPPLAWNAGSADGRYDSVALVFVDYDITAHTDALVAGENILGIHGLNRSMTSSDFLIGPELHGVVTTGGGDSELRYFESPTPGEVNSIGIIGFIDEVDFSVERGFCNTSFTLELTCDTPEVEIRYTTDGTVPTASNGMTYTGGIFIDTTTVVRATAVKAGYADSAPVTHTYIFLGDVVNQSNNQTGRGFPDEWFAGIDHYTHGDRQTRPGDYEMDPLIVGDAVYGPQMIEALTSIPSIALTFEPYDLWDPYDGIYPNSIQRAASDIKWEKPTSIELLDPAGVEQWQVNAGARISGELARWASVNDKQSFRIVFRGEYGPTKLAEPFFDDPDIDRYDTVLLRGNYGDGWVKAPPASGQFLRDIYTHDAFRATGNAGIRGRFVHLYLNGIYWGLYEAIERPDDAYNADHFGGNKDDYDVIKGGVVFTATNGMLKDGDRTAWDTMFHRFFDADADGVNIDGQVTPLSDAELAEVELWLDVDRFIDYMMTLWTNARFDFPRKNWYAVAERNPADGPPTQPFRFFTWDSEASLSSAGSTGTASRFNGTDATNDTGPVRIYRRLVTNATFRRRWGDRAQQLLCGDGPLNPANSAARYAARAAEIDKAVIAESARWGDSYYEWEGDSTSVVTRDDWIDTRDGILNGFFPARTDNVLQQMAEVDLYSIVAAPVFSPAGGEYKAGTQLTITNPDATGTIWVTLDGTDPANSATRFAYPGPLTLAGCFLVKARIESAGQWSPLTQAGFMPTGGPALTISEIMYNPALPRVAGAYQGEDYEFIEIVNTGDQYVSLQAIAITDGVEFEFANSAKSSLAPGGYVLVVSNLAAFEDRYGTGLPVAGEYAGQLANDGETVTLTAAGMTFESFAYDDGSNWPGRADGRGASLERIDTAADPADDDAWRSSGAYGGSPGSAGAGATVDVVVNEVLTHTDGEPTDSIELLNAGDVPVDISGWFLSDTAADYWKFQIPAMPALQPGAFVVFDEHDFNPTGLDLDPDNDDPDDFGLSGAHGDDVWLMAADAEGNLLRFADHVEFGGTFAGQSLGRCPDGTGTLTAMATVTLGEPNSSPQPAPVRISEIMYNPGGPERDDQEFVEILNADTVARDLTGWRIRGGVDYDFDTAETLAPGERIVVLSFEPMNPDNAPRVAEFRATYGIDGSVRLVGGFSGKLDNDGERVSLQEPDTPPAEEPDFTPHITADEVTYDNESPWPTDEEIAGLSLHRSPAGGWAGYVANWTAAPPSPGTGGKPGDIDGDGDVDLADFIIFKTNFGRSGVTAAEGDLDGDTDVDLADFVIFKTNFGT